MMKRFLLFISVFLVACSAGSAIPSDAQNSNVSQAAKDDCKDFLLHSMRMNCEYEFMAQPRVDHADKQMKNLLASLQTKMQKADAAWSKGSINDGDPKYVEAFNAAQKAWEEYAAKTCLLDSFTARGGTDQPHQHWKCDLKQTEARLIQLKEWDDAF